METPNVTQMFADIETDLLSNLSQSLADNDWKGGRFEAYRAFKTRNAKIFAQYDVPVEAQRELESAYLKAGIQTQNEIEAAAKKGQALSIKGGTRFAVNDVKVQALIIQMSRDIEAAKVSAFRVMDDVYRRTLYQAQLAMSTGLYSLDESIDMATHDFLASGINSIRYRDGRLVNIVSYAEMAMRTGTRRAGFYGEGAVRADWGEFLVYVSQYGACSDTCLPWQGRVYFDDVYSGGNPSLNTGDYPLLSTAISAGLFHPNCRHKLSTWYPGLSKVPERMDAEQTHQNAELEERQRYNERQIRKYKRLDEGSLDPANKEKYALKVKQWQAEQRKLIKDHPDVLRRDYPREQTKGFDVSQSDLKVQGDVAQHTKYKAIYGNKIPDNIEKFREMKYNNPAEWERIKAAKQDTLNHLDYSDEMFGKFGDIEVRSWYKYHDESIPLDIIPDEPFELQVRQKSALRDMYKQQARDMMANREKAAALDITEPIVDFDTRLADKMRRKNMSRDEALADMLETVRKTRKSVNREMGLE